MTKEVDIENSLITKLTDDLKYIYRPDIRDRNSLENNFREKFQELNKVNLSDYEFNRLLEDIINPDVFKSASILRERNTFTREDGTPLQYSLVNIRDWCKNTFEVVNQLSINTKNSNHRYDVILLINGIPAVQIELKALDVSPRRAMQQIVDYKNDLGNGYTNTLLCFMQLFIVSNNTNTYYFANNHNMHFQFNADEQFLPVYKLADRRNKKISNLHDFANSFLAKCTLGEMISRYMVLVKSEKKILVMRPYQVYAVKAIINSIEQNRGNGYIWHTTGSGKTLTSFKAATILKDNKDIEKCIFVVDRKDLDRQTREEFNKFQEGCVEENTNTEKLVQRLLSEDYADKVIVTTIQKLGLALNENSIRNKKKILNGVQSYAERLTPLKDKRVVFIFDECHRSQFGDNHDAIKEFFPNAQLFGFTGTPIFDKNANYTKVDGKEASFRTTKDIFQKRLHSYTITHAIDDNNVLRFHIDYYKPEGNAKPKTGDSIAKQAIVDAIISKHEAATSNRRFNAVLATASINDAIDYYKLFKQKSLDHDDYNHLNIACVFSPPSEGNKDIKQIQEDLPQELEDNKTEPEIKKAALKEIINDYNTQFGTNHSINEFDLYYQDVQQRVKDQKYSNTDYPHKDKIDIVIVVDMLLTGFDSKYLNTMYVDKNLKHHGLIQAFSRTNRILNDSKPYGNIMDFRQQEKAVENAITLFSGEEDGKPKEIWLVDPAPVVIKNYEEAIENLDKFMKSQNLNCKPEEVSNLEGDNARAEFINKFKEVQRLKTKLDQFTNLNEDDSEKIKTLMPDDDLRSFRAMYLDTAQDLKAKQDKYGDKSEPEVQQLDFEFVLFASSIIDYDYIMGLIANFTNEKPNKQKMTREQLINLLCSNSNLMDERDDIVAYINSLEEGTNQTEKQIREGYITFKNNKTAIQLTEIANKYTLEISALNVFIDNIMSRMIFDDDKLSDLLEPLELGWKARTKKELELMEELMPLLKKQAQGREISGLEIYE